MSPPDHWGHHARQWARIGPPLRPGPEDVAAVAAEVERWCAHHARPPRLLLLGVTPELAAHRWPAGTSLVAIDRSRPMIGAVFPAAAVPPATVAAVGEWAALPVAAGAVDVIIGDGALSTLRFSDQYRAVAAELARVLAPGGRLVLRLFAAPAEAEPLAAVAADLAAGAVDSFHSLKWRAAMAVQPAERNVGVVDIAAAVDALAPDRDALAARTGWSRDAIDTIDAYRGSAARYSFPTLAEVEAALAPWFVDPAVRWPGYPLGRRCPTVAWTRGR